MRLHRFYVSQPLGEEVVIDDVSLVSQWSKVFRYVRGDFVILFGNGEDCTYTILEIDKRSARLALQEKKPSLILKQHIFLCLSLIKKDNFELVVQKGTELGVSTFIPLLSERSEKKNLSFDRLRKIAQEAAEQCGRGDIPEIRQITSLEEALNAMPPEAVGYILNIGGESYTKKQQQTPIYLFIGPEGGWGNKDLEMINNSKLSSLGLTQTVLRAETAAIAACALIAVS